MEKGDITQIETSIGKTALDHKVKDGDEALQILHAEFEPYTKEEEKRVLRKIDLRLVILMLIINGLQFVDKTVFLKATLIYIDHPYCSDVRYHHASTPRWSRLQPFDQYILHWIPRRAVSDKLFDATLSHWEVSHCQHCPVGYHVL